jgi:hypothetical protein
MRTARRARGSIRAGLFGPMKVIVTDDTTLHRPGSIIDCSLFPTGIKCRKF